MLFAFWEVLLGFWSDCRQMVLNEHPKGEGKKGYIRNKRGREKGPFGVLIPLEPHVLSWFFSRVSILGTLRYFRHSAKVENGIFIAPQSRQADGNN